MSVRLYEDDYVDYSAHVEFETLIGGSIGPELAIDPIEGHIELS